MFKGATPVDEPWAPKGATPIDEDAPTSPPPTAKPRQEGLDATGQAYRLASRQGGPEPGLIEQGLGGAKHAWDRAAMGLKGLVTDLTPEDKALLGQGETFVRQTGPASTVGQIAGDLAMSAAPVARGAQAATRLASMLRLGAAAPLVGDVAANAAYSAATAPEDRGTAAAFGAGGALAGRAITRTLGGAVIPTDEAQAMLNKGVRLTPGQAGGGKGVGALADTYERALETVPLIGRPVTKAKAVGLEDWNRSLVRKAEVPVKPNRAGRAVFEVNPAAPVGREALDELGTAYSGAYKRMLPEGTPLKFDAQVSQVYDDVTKRLAEKVAPSSRGKFHEVAEWVGQNLREGVDASQWKEVVGGELDAAIKAAKQDGQHSLYVSLSKLNDELEKSLPHFAGMPAEAANMVSTDKGYRTFKVLEKAMSKAGPLKRDGVLYPSDLATTAVQKKHSDLLSEALRGQKVFGNAPGPFDKIGNIARSAAVGGVGHVAAGAYALPVAVTSLLGTTDVGRRFLMGQIPWQAVVKAHPEIASQVLRAVADQQGQ